MKSLDPTKATGPGDIPVKILEIARNVTHSHLTNVINRDIKENKFSKDTKTAFVRPFIRRTIEIKFKIIDLEPS